MKYQTLLRKLKEYITALDKPVSAFIAKPIVDIDGNVLMNRGTTGILYNYYGALIFRPDETCKRINGHYVLYRSDILIFEKELDYIHCPSLNLNVV